MRAFVRRERLFLQRSECFVSLWPPCPNRFDFEIPPLKRLPPHTATFLPWDFVSIFLRNPLMPVLLVPHSFPSLTPDRPKSGPMHRNKMVDPPIPLLGIRYRYIPEMLPLFSLFRN